MLADATTAFALFVGLSILRFGTDAWERTWASAGIDARLAAFLYGLALVAVLWVQGLYRLRVRWSRRREALDVLFAVLLLAVVVFTALFLFKLPNVSRLFLILLFPSQALLTIASRNAHPVSPSSALRACGRSIRYMLIVGANPTGASVRRRPGSPHRTLASSRSAHLAGPCGSGQRRRRCGSDDRSSATSHDIEADPARDGGRRGRDLPAGRRPRHGRTDRPTVRRRGPGRSDPACPAGRDAPRRPARGVRGDADRPLARLRTRIGRSG